MTAYTSWGHTLYPQQQIHKLQNRFDALPVVGNKKILPYGKGRSYGDVCLNDQNVVIPTQNLDRFIHFDPMAGTIRCEAGACLDDVLAFLVPHGFFVPVTPGTKYVTLGGMLANDVHGKNHHQAGTFGAHVNEFTLSRSDKGVINCSKDQNDTLFSATIGGLGLTGLITEIEIRLKRIESSHIEQEVIPFSTIDEFMQITNDSDEGWEYTVAWIDSLAQGTDMGRGVFFRGRHAAQMHGLDGRRRGSRFAIPFYLPQGLLSPKFLRYFNRFYYQTHKRSMGMVDYDTFFYPLDSIRSWNRVYGRQGFYQYQCVVPMKDADSILKELLNVCSRFEMGSFLSVLKKFGNITSPGMLSFPRPGYTLALDFPNSGSKVTKLMDELDRIVMTVDGAVYPAKDARMSAAAFKQYFPDWQLFSKFIDPAFSSSFWRRIMMEERQ